MDHIQLNYFPSIINLNRTQGGARMYSAWYRSEGRQAHILAVFGVSQAIFRRRWWIPSGVISFSLHNTSASPFLDPHQECVPMSYGRNISHLLALFPSPKRPHFLYVAWGYN